MLSASQTCKVAQPKSLLFKSLGTLLTRGRGQIGHQRVAKGFFLRWKAEDDSLISASFPAPPPTHTSQSVFQQAPPWVCPPHPLSQKTPDMLVYIKEQN